MNAQDSAILVDRLIIKIFNDRTASVESRRRALENIITTASGYLNSLPPASPPNGGVKLVNMDDFFRDSR